MIWAIGETIGDISKHRGVGGNQQNEAKVTCTGQQCGRRAGFWCFGNLDGEIVDFFHGRKISFRQIPSRF